MTNREQLLPHRGNLPAIGFDHLARWTMENLVTGEGTTRCTCGWIAPSRKYRDGTRQQAEHSRYMRRMEDAAAQSGFIPETWRANDD